MMILLAQHMTREWDKAYPGWIGTYKDVCTMHICHSDDRSRRRRKRWMVAVWLSNHAWSELTRDGKVPSDFDIQIIERHRNYTEALAALDRLVARFWLEYMR